MSLIYRLAIVLIIPFCPWFLIKISRTSEHTKIWLSDCYDYFKKILGIGALAYGVMLLGFITACTIKPLEFKTLMLVDVHLKMFIVAWTLGIVKTSASFSSNKDKAS